MLVVLSTMLLAISSRLLVTERPALAESTSQVDTRYVFVFSFFSGGLCVLLFLFGGLQTRSSRIS